MKKQFNLHAFLLMMKKNFNIQRFLLLLTRELILNKMNILIMSVSLTVMYLALDYGSRYLPVLSLHIRHYYLYPAAAIFYCMSVTGSVFSELNTSEKKIEFLMLPASTVEKYVVKYLFTTFVLILISIATLSAASIIVELVKVLHIPGRSMNSIMYNYSYAQFLTVMSYYFPLHAFFFFGAVYFRKLEFAKTLIAVIAVFGIINMFYSTLLNPFNYIVSTEYSHVLSVNSKEYSNEFASLLRVVVFNILPFIFLAAGLIRLKETEAANGI